MQKDMNIFPLTYAILHGIRVIRAARPEKSPIKRHFMHVSAFERNIGKRYFVYLYCIVRYTGSPAESALFDPGAACSPPLTMLAPYTKGGAHGVPRRARLRGATAPPQRSGGFAAGTVRPAPRSPGKKDRRTPGYMPGERRLHVQKRVLLIRLGKAPGRRGSDAWADHVPERCACWGYSPDPHTEP